CPTFLRACARRLPSVSACILFGSAARKNPKSTAPSAIFLKRTITKRCPPFFCLKQDRPPHNRRTSARRLADGCLYVFQLRWAAPTNAGSALRGRSPFSG